MLCFRKFPVAEKFLDKRGSIKILRRKIFVPQCREISKGNPSVLCFRKFLVANKFTDKKGEYQDFLSKSFCVTLPKKFVSEPLSVSLISGIEKFYASEGNFIIFYRKIFVSQSRKISFRKPSLLCFRKVLVAKKFFDKKGGGYQDFASKYFCHTVTKIAIGEPVKISFFSGIEKV